MARLTITELEQIRQRAEAASPGPWEWRKYYEVEPDDPEMPILVSAAGNVLNFGDCTTFYPIEGSPPNTDDALFISEAREAVPKLLTEVETLITEKAAARRMLDELIGEMANAAEAGRTLLPDTVQIVLETVRKELIDHGE